MKIPNRIHTGDNRFVEDNMIYCFFKNRHGNSRVSRYYRRYEKLRTLKMCERLAFSTCILK